MGKVLIKKEVKGIVTCDKCHRDFALIKEEHYIAVANGKTGLAAISGGEQPSCYDAIDCPHCGCQKLLQVRLRPMLMELEEEEENDNG